MSFVELSVDAEFDEMKEKEFIKDLKAVKSVKNVEIDRPLAGGAAIIFVIEVAAIVIPAIVTIAQRLMNRPRIIKFKCPETGKKVKVRLEGIEDEDKIAEIVKHAYTTSCGSKD